MPKQGEIEYVARMSAVLGVSQEEVESSLLQKPFSEARRGFYLMDLGQIFRLLPPPPVRLLDLGCGPGWTSKMFALSGYAVVGLDLSPDMIRIARINCSAPTAQFFVHDYEDSIEYGKFDCVVIYDALHHAVEESRVIRNAFACLDEGGVLVTAEPGAGHAQSPETRREAQRWKTTEKDMPFLLQRELMLAAGFREVHQYVRLSELPLAPVEISEEQQNLHVAALFHRTRGPGFTSIVIAKR